jgi:histidinol-phosphate aminotransferase
MAPQLSRRTLLKSSTLALAASALPQLSAHAVVPEQTARLCFNENPYGPSPAVAQAIARELPRSNRYADAATAQAFAEQVAAYEQVPVEQVVLGEILGLLGLYLGSQGGPGGEFLYSTPGYLALIDSAANVGSVGVGVPLNAEYRNDLSALLARIGPRTRALYLVNPHNPTGTVNDDAAFKSFLVEASRHAVAIVDEAYLEYTPDFRTRTAANLTREGANVAVFRTFDKIQGLAGLPIGYVLAPKPLAEALRKQGAGDAESLGRLNLAAAQAALADTAQVASTREAVARERATWLRTLDKLRLPHTETVSNFIFFNAGRPQAQVAQSMLARGINIGRAHPPFTNWARISIGLPEENRRAQAALRQILDESPSA